MASGWALFVSACAAPQVAYEPAAPAAVVAEPAADVHVFLLGDAGAATPGRDSVLADLGHRLDEVTASGAPAVVVYLGDNIYELGARPENEAADLPLVAAQVEPLAALDGVRAVFLPGNHDWGRGAPDEVGRERLRLQADWLGRVAGGRDVALRPSDGCPGPVTEDVGPVLRLVFVDSESLLRGPPAWCPDADTFYARLRDTLGTAGTRHVLVLSHHPMMSGGPHGGHVGLFDGIPTLTYLATRAGLERQDLGSATYEGMIEGLREAFAPSPPLVYAAGHEHNIQVVAGTRTGDPVFHVVSGSVSKATNTGRIEGTRYATNGNGYVHLALSAERVRAVVRATPEGGGVVRAVFGCDLIGGGGPCREAAMAAPAR